MACRGFLLVLCILTTIQEAPAASIVGGAGSKGFKFLQVVADARSAALARASVAAVSGPAALTVNPAGGAGTKSFRIAVAHTEWLGAIRHEYLGLAWPQFGGSVALAVRAQSSGDIPLRSIDDGVSLIGVPSAEPSGTYGVHDAAFTVGYARRAGDFDWGVGASYIVEKVYFSRAAATALNLGARWHRDRLTLGAALRNVGWSGKLRADRIPLPWDVQFGGMYERTIFGTTVRAMADVRAAPDFHETLHLGAEVQLIPALVLRTGYTSAQRHNPDDLGLAAGAGIQFGPFRLDYAFIPDRDGLGSGHILNLAFGG